MPRSSDRCAACWSACGIVRTYRECAVTAKQFLALMKRSLAAWSDDYAPSMGAALSYYTLFSITPLLVIVIALAGFFFGDDAVRGEIFHQLSGLLGDDAARAVEEML